MAGIEPPDVKRGDVVVLTFEGDQYLSVVAMASPNRKSLMLSFESIIAGHFGMFPASWDDKTGGYFSIINGAEIEVRKWQ